MIFGRHLIIPWSTIINLIMHLGLHRSELTAGEIADEMEKERKYLQLTTSEYLLRVNEIRTKKGVDLLQHLIKYYHSQHK